MLGPPSRVQDVRDPPLGCLTVTVELTSTPDLRSQSDHCIVATLFQQLIYGESRYGGNQCSHRALA